MAADKHAYGMNTKESLFVIFFFRPRGFCPEKGSMTIYILFDKSTGSKNLQKEFLWFFPLLYVPYWGNIWTIYATRHSIRKLAVSAGSERLGTKTSYLNSVRLLSLVLIVPHIKRRTDCKIRNERIVHAFNVCFITYVRVSTMYVIHYFPMHDPFNRLDLVFAQWDSKVIVGFNEYPMKRLRSNKSHVG